MNIKTKAASHPLFNIRPMCVEDIDIIAIDYCPPWSTEYETKERWTKYLREQQEGIRSVGVINNHKEILGYGSLLLKSEYPHFSNIPEINDVWIYEQHRSKGHGT